ncbi:unnamed protein product [Lactuca saligna]|uniref:Uncharacterized protein n=1 Tax=Lactuca saligna TaxID=75948 RepID=A0AA36EHR3_LACSI|nr:unnamed protein product [Lactuca saligna]
MIVNIYDNYLRYDTFHLKTVWGLRERNQGRKKHTDCKNLSKGVYSEREELVLERECEREREKGEEELGFMSAGSLNLIGAPLKLCISFALFICSYLCCFTQQSLLLCVPTVSMRLRPKRTCSGVECFGGFHINSFGHVLRLQKPPEF